MKHFAGIVAVMLLLAACSPQDGGQRIIGEVDGVQFVEMRAERLPDLPKPRGGHHIVLLGDEPTLVGGITDGFVLEPTIAYLKDGA